MSTDVSASTLTIRVIKSFPHRTCKSLVLHNINLETTTVGDLKARIYNDIRTLPGWKPYLNVQFNTVKLYTHAKGTKTQNLIVNLDNDPEWMFDDDSKTLAEVGCESF